MNQVLLKFKKKNSILEEDFILSSSNISAYNLVYNYQNWEHKYYPKALYLYGEKFTGKTILANIFANNTDAIILKPNEIKAQLVSKSNAFVIEDFDELKQYEEKKILHFFNISQEQDKYLLITSKFNQSELNINLADLCSRIKSLNSIKISQPDDELLYLLILKQFTDKNLRIDAKIIKYILKNSDRSFESIMSLIDKLNEKSLILGKKVTLSLVKDVLNGQ